MRRRFGEASVANLTAIANLTSAADKVPYFRGAGTADVHAFTSYGRTVVALANAAALRSNLDVARLPTGTVATFRQPAAPTGGCSGRKVASRSGRNAYSSMPSVAALMGTGGSMDSGEPVCARRRELLFHRRVGLDITR